MWNVIQWLCPLSFVPVCPTIHPCVTSYNDLFAIAASGWIRTTISTIQYNTIKSVQYHTKPRLIVASQAIRYKRVPKFISSGWDVLKSLSMAQMVCHWWISFFRQQIVQARCFAQHTAPEERAATRACLVQKVLMSYSSRCPRILFSSPAAALSYAVGLYQEGFYLLLYKCTFSSFNFLLC